MYNCLTDITDPCKEKFLLAGSDDDKNHSCMFYVIHQLVSCARKVKTGIVNKKGPAERYRYKALTSVELSNLLSIGLGWSR